ncbi:homoserine/homoserine lactone efflux protein [Yersinia enterocolitica]|uniref:LysE family translocator n=1 Tax=Yersinia enterocolitica TaxID=630 RepID=UPI0005DCBE7C|nr:LysE family translocator [Yersinia enterocolitica]CNG75257.1 homoserine/homoserine lactone efflux protein [Yersinia enterocolitica]
MPLSVISAFWVVSILFVITPGVDWAYAISAGLRGRVFIPAVLGMLGGHFIATLVVAAGVGALIAGTPAAMIALTVMGSAYLLWLGIGMIRHPSVPEKSQDGVSGSWRHWALRGLCVSGLNPKVFLLFLALLPQFTSPESLWPLPVQMTVLGILHVFTCGVVYLLVGYFSRAVLQTRPQAAMRVSQVSGGLMIIIALILIAEQFL